MGAQETKILETITGEQSITPEDFNELEILVPHLLSINNKLTEKYCYQLLKNCTKSKNIEILIQHLKQMLSQLQEEFFQSQVNPELLSARNQNSIISTLAILTSFCKYMFENKIPYDGFFNGSFSETKKEQSGLLKVVPITFNYFTEKKTVYIKIPQYSQGIGSRLPFSFTDQIIQHFQYLKSYLIQNRDSICLYNVQGKLQTYQDIVEHYAIDSQETLADQSFKQLKKKSNFLEL